MVPVRSARPEDVAAIVQTLVRSFDADPVMQWLLRQDAKRQAAYAEFFEVFLREQALPQGHVLVTEDCGAAALWMPPDTWHLSLWRQLLHFPSFIRCAGRSRILRGFNAFSQMEKHHPRTPHFYLPFVGVDPALQGRGYASAVVKPVLQRCDQQRLGAYWENTNEANLPRVTGWGFVATGDIDLGPGAPHYRSMWRAPAT